jgi:hypothetical protein
MGGGGWVREGIDLLQSQLLGPIKLKESNMSLLSYTVHILYRLKNIEQL